MPHGSEANKLTVEGVDPPARQRAPRRRQLSDTPLSAGMVLETGKPFENGFLCMAAGGNRIPNGMARHDSNGLSDGALFTYSEQQR
jgi:hypothetical protein